MKGHEIFELGERNGRRRGEEGEKKGRGGRGLAAEAAAERRKEGTLYLAQRRKGN